MSSGEISFKQDLPKAVKYKCVMLALNMLGLTKDYEYRHCQEVDKLSSRKNGDVIDLDFQMRVRVISSNPKVRSNCSKVAVSYGPMIYCLEQHDNPYSLDCIAIDPYSPALGDFSHQFNAFTIKAKGFDLDFEASELYFDFSPTEPKPIDLTLIPYFAFANRSVGEMSVWLPSTFLKKGGTNLLF